MRSEFDHKFSPMRQFIMAHLLGNYRIESNYYSLKNTAC
jgi:hypothetical protein